MAKKSQAQQRFEIAFIEGVLKRAPDFVEALACLGDLYTKIGAYEEGLRIDERLAHIRVGEPLVFYNLACSYSLTGDMLKARAAMARAFELGYDDVEFLLQDADLADLKADSAFQEQLKEWRASLHLRPQEAR